jgi:site-specific DNA recombinase
MKEPSKQITNKRAVIYVRVSTTEQADEGNSLATQEKACREYAGKNGYEMVENGVFIERGESAKTTDRTELQKMLLLCAQRKSGITAVIVYKIDRLSRQTADYTQLRALFQRYGIAIKSTTENIVNDPVGRLTENMIASIAQFDNDVRAERCSNGMLEAVRDGRYVWGAPLGYSNVRVADKATIAQNEMASLVRRAFELTATASSPTDDVRQMVCGEGLRKKNGQPVSKTYFYEMLRNELYMGWTEKFGERHRGKFEAIVSEELFAQVQRVLKNKGHRVLQYKKDRAEFPLRRFVLNPTGIKLTGSFSKGKYPFYRFNGASGNYDRDEMEKQFAFKMDSYSFESPEIARLKRLVEKQFHRTVEGGRKEARVIETRLKELEEEQTVLVQKNIKGVLNDHVLQKELSRIDKTEMALRANLALQVADNGSPEEAIAFAERYLEHPSSVWRKAGISTQIKLQWFQFPSGMPFDGKKFGTPELCSVFKAKELILSPLSSRVDLTGFEPVTSSLQMRRSTN